MGHLSPVGLHPVLALVDHRPQFEGVVLSLVVATLGVH
jgi:hypothetical protein